MNPLIMTDFYKVHHNKMYPEGMTLLYSNFTPRKSRIKGVDKVVFFGLQAFIKEYLIYRFNRYFFQVPWEEVNAQYKEVIDVDTSHIKELHTLGYLPIEIKAVPEGTLVPIGVPCFTIKNTHPGFGWLTNYLETLISTEMWQATTSATIAYEYKKLLEQYALETTGSTDFVQWQGHDFSMRGMSSVRSAVLSGMGHLTSFTGTDTIPAIYMAKKYYNIQPGELVGASVPASEHSVQCMHYDYETGNEDAYIEQLLKAYPSGIVSMVSDGFNLWDMIIKTLPKYRDQIMSREGKLVIRPDSGDPVDILCGYNSSGLSEQKMDGLYYNGKKVDYPEYTGVIELLWQIFGGTINEYGYKVLDPHIGAIYGDSITLDRARQICERLKAKGFASTNVVLGIGSYTYQYNTRDTFGFAMKATYGEVTEFCNSTDECVREGYGCSKCQGKNIKPKEIFKDPVTDDGTKKSKKGLLKVYYQDAGTDESKLVVKDQCTWEEEQQGILTTVFHNGKILNETSLSEIRNLIKTQIKHVQPV